MASPSPARRANRVRTLHRVAGVAAFLVILLFWTSTVTVELFGGAHAVAAVKQAIAWGLIALIPALALTGATGFRLGGASRAPLILRKKRRMPFIAGNGVLILAPAAIALAVLAARSEFGRTFMLIQAAELVAGLANLVLIGLNLRDGLRAARETANFLSRLGGGEPEAEIAPRRR